MGRRMGNTGGVHARKLHGWGNDFVVVLDADHDTPLDPGAVAAAAAVVCDRRRGVGADGLIHGQVPSAADHDGAAVVMALYNADGSRAEMSGNGIRCLAHAVALTAGTPPAEVAIHSDVGRRVARLTRPAGVPGDGDSPAEILVAVSLGAVTTMTLPPPPTGGALGDLLGAHDYVGLRVGNPHVVIAVVDPDAVDLAAVGVEAQAWVPGGVNVEVIAPDGDNRVVMRVFERGVGPTEACGTGACAVAWAARHWGFAGDGCTVAMPGGDAEVRLVGDDAELTGPSVLVATLEVSDALAPTEGAPA